MTTWQDVVTANQNYKQVLETYGPDTGFTMDWSTKTNLQKLQEALHDQLCLDWKITKDQLLKESRLANHELSEEAEEKYKEFAGLIMMCLVATF